MHSPSRPPAGQPSPGQGCALAVALLLSLTPACERGSEPAPATDRPRLTVCAVNYPLAYFAERLGDDDVEVGFPAPDGVDPATWRPTPEAIGLYQAADLLLLNGAGYAPWVATAPLPRSRQVDTGAAFGERTITLDHVITHSHGSRGMHSHGLTASTTWLDFEQAASQAGAVAAALQRALPAHAQAIATRTTELLEQIGELDRRLLALGPTPPLLASHPVYQYLARRYHLDLDSLHWEPDVAPDRAAWRDLDARLAERPVRWMLWEAEPLPAVRAELLARGVEPLLFAPCANRPPGGDWLATMQANVQTLLAALGD